MKRNLVGKILGKIKIFVQDFVPIRTALKGSELRCQNFDLVKFREIIPRNPCYGTFFSRNFESKFSKSSDPPAGPPEISEKLYFLDLGICIS